MKKRVSMLPLGLLLLIFSHCATYANYGCDRMFNEEMCVLGKHCAWGVSDSGCPRKCDWKARPTLPNGGTCVDKPCESMSAEVCNKRDECAWDEKRVTCESKINHLSAHRDTTTSST